ncbi:zinc-binding alcohol dehydrogenase family protein [Nitratireductor mangrovi]|uniref:Zinc-binding alcohol dehydrogenase family protein n=1 Tax=Nitratireductor mangrovi TaxID=2599600 RepID=A0A5B8KVY7_9HYPH|nr:zinc-binding alcohol dehydrogenase family protein [Nitratireductor mangrovi]QDY99720.1 zinc-binding alcohol dehydrogenase family protein [Nitratireductor mangrovi]
MEALVCLEPGKLKLTELAAPKANPGMALLRPHRVGICGTDYHIFEGKHPYLEYPRVMGHELAVEVVEAPAGTGFAAGDICVVNPYLSCGQCVACRAGKPNCCTKISVLGVHQDGGMAGLLALPAGNLIPANGLTVDECATVEFLAIGAHAVRRGGTTGNDRALVVGAGPIGLGLAIFAARAGASVTILDVDPERTAAAGTIAKVETVAAGTDAQQALDLVTDGDGFDIVFDATGSQKAMENGFECVAHGGRYVLVSVVKDSITFSDPDFHRKEMTLLGSRNATSADFEEVIAAIKDGTVPVDRLITHRTSLRDAAEDIPRWATQKNGLIKALIEID